MSNATLTTKDKYGALLLELKQRLPSNRFVQVSMSELLDRHHANEKAIRILTELGAIEINGKIGVQCRYKGSKELQEITISELLHLLGYNPEHKARFRSKRPYEPTAPTQPPQLPLVATSRAEALTIAPEFIEPVSVIQPQPETDEPTEVPIEIRYDNKCLHLTVARHELRAWLTKLL